MMRLAVKCLVATLFASSALPCLATAPARVASHGECKGMAAMPAAQAPVPAKTPADCCITDGSRLPPAAAATIGHDGTGVIVLVPPAPFLEPPVSRVINDRDLRARSAPTLQRLSVLLI
jgi:hypothetical protein